MDSTLRQEYAHLKETFQIMLERSVEACAFGDTLSEIDVAMAKGYNNLLRQIISALDDRMEELKTETDKDG